MLRFAYPLAFYPCLSMYADQPNPIFFFYLNFRAHSNLCFVAHCPSSSKQILNRMRYIDRGDRPNKDEVGWEKTWDDHQIVEEIPRTSWSSSSSVRFVHRRDALVKSTLAIFVTCFFIFASLHSVATFWMDGFADGLTVRANFFMLKKVSDWRYPFVRLESMISRDESCLVGKSRFTFDRFWFD